MKPKIRQYIYRYFGSENTYAIGYITSVDETGNYFSYKALETNSKILKIGQYYTAYDLTKKCIIADTLEELNKIRTFQ